MDDKQKSNNPLGQYNTEAFVPENGSTSRSVNTGGVSTNMSGNDAENSTSLGGNASEARGEGREGGSEVKDGYEEGLQLEATSRASNEVVGDSGKATGKKGGKTWLVAILIVLLAVLGVVGWILLGARGEEVGNGNKDEIGAVTDAEQGRNESDSNSNGVVELSLDNQLVQRLYHNFDRVGQSYSSTLDFYSDEGVRGGNVSKEKMLDIALAASSGYRKYCRGQHIMYYGENNSESYDAGLSNGCYDGEKVWRKVEEIFGKDVELKDGDVTGGYCGARAYSVESDEFYVPMDGCGGSCLFGLGRELNKAERDEDHIYLYETAYGETCQSLCNVNGDVIAANKFDESWNLISEFNFDDYRDQLEQFKWTFTKNIDGEYVFTGLEQVK